MLTKDQESTLNKLNFMKKIIFSLIATLSTALLAANPQAIVFDFGGVMTGEPNRDAVISFIKESFHFSEIDFEKINIEKRTAVKKGMTDEEFWIAYAQNNGIQLPSNWSESFKLVMKNAIGINQNMYDLVEELQQLKIPIALLSNIDERLSKLIREFGLYQPFNPCLLSCEIGIEKPDPKAFEILLKQLNLSAAEVIFIDDRNENIEAAKKLGLDAILFESEQQLREELAIREILNGE